MKQGFSLVELSIVLVILGLLTGGILAGQSLIRAAELRSVSTEFSRYVTASQTFRDKYFQLPGDFTKATDFWTSAGGNGANAACQAGTATTTTCSGNGDGYVNLINSASVWEANRFWQHLALAGLIEGAYNGQSGVTVGLNTPRSKISGATWRILGGPGYTAGDAYGFGGTYGNAMYFYHATSGALLKPEEAWNIDTKMDDGAPGSGKVYGIKGDGTTIICTTGDNVAPPGDANATYVLSNSNKGCSLVFLQAI